MAISFSVAIRPLFRETDSTQGYELDLSSYEEVRPRAPENYARLVDGSMPCDEPWPPDRLEFFRLWMDEGCAP